MLGLLVRGALFFVYAAQFLRPSSEVTVLSSPPLNRAEHLLIHRIQSHTNPKRRKVFLKQAGQKSVKEELLEQRAKEGGRVSAEGSDTRLGPRCRRFESCHLDQKTNSLWIPSAEMPMVSGFSKNFSLQNSKVKQKI